MSNIKFPKSIMVYELSRPLDETELVNGLQWQVFPGLHKLNGTEPSFGWTGAEHPLYTDGFEPFGGWYVFHLVCAQKVFAGPIYKAEVESQVKACMELDGSPFVSRLRKNQIREDVKQRLIPDWPPRVSAIRCFYQPGSQHLYAETLTFKKNDLLVIHFRHAFEVTLYPMDAEYYARTLGDSTHRLGESICNVIHKSDVTFGENFLTWLYWKACDLNEVSDGCVAAYSPMKMISKELFPRVDFVGDQGCDADCIANKALREGYWISYLTCSFDVVASWTGIMQVDSVWLSPRKFTPAYETEKDWTPVESFRRYMEHVFFSLTVLRSYVNQFVERLLDGRYIREDLPLLRKWVSEGGAE